MHILNSKFTCTTSVASTSGSGFGSAPHCLPPPNTSANRTCLPSVESNGASASSANGLSRTATVPLATVPLATIDSGKGAPGVKEGVKGGVNGEVDRGAKGSPCEKAAEPEASLFAV